MVLPKQVGIDSIIMSCHSQEHTEAVLTSKDLRRENERQKKLRKRGRISEVIKKVMCNLMNFSEFVQTDRCLTCLSPTAAGNIFGTIREKEVYERNLG
jgi:hypothetical protein